MFGTVVIATGTKSNLITATSVLFSLEILFGTLYKANFTDGAIIKKLLKLDTLWRQKQIARKLHHWKREQERETRVHELELRWGRHWNVSHIQSLLIIINNRRKIYVFCQQWFDRQGRLIFNLYLHAGLVQVTKFLFAGYSTFNNVSPSEQNGGGGCTTGS